MELSVLGDMLSIRGERREERREEGEGQRWLLREQRYGAFERMVRLPSSVKADRATAEFRDGMLTVTLPKSEQAKDRRIPVQAGKQRGQKAPIEAEAKAARRPSASSGDHLGLGAAKRCRHHAPFTEKLPEFAVPQPVP